VTVTSDLINILAGNNNEGAQIRRHFLTRAQETEGIRPVLQFLSQFTTICEKSINNSTKMSGKGVSKGKGKGKRVAATRIGSPEAKRVKEETEGEGAGPSTSEAPEAEPAPRAGQAEEEGQVPGLESLVAPESQLAFLRAIKNAVSEL
jgi:hypothetical protein